MPSTRRDETTEIFDRLNSWGFDISILSRLGAFAVAWSVFETNLETALWACRGDKVDKVRPWTDDHSVSAQIKELSRDWPQLSETAKEVLRAASDGAHHLMEYRHAIMHGAMCPSEDMMPSFIRNPRWHGEIRKRPSHVAHVDEALLGLAINSAWFLCRVVFRVKEVCEDLSKMQLLENMKADVVRSRSQAGELRYLTELMNSEKY